MIYLDNSATTYPKPQSVVAAVCNALRRYSFNSGRGGYAQSVNTAEMIFSSRQSIAELVNAEPQNIVFTQNCTLALNMAIKGLAREGDHIIISSLEHNAVYRPVYALSKRKGISYTVVPYDYDEDKLLSNFENSIQENTSFIVCTGASNVFGCAMPISKIGALAKKHGIRFVVDGAQIVGVTDIDIVRDNIDILCAAGHKGLYGPLATGFMALNDSVLPQTIIEGGTGSLSMEPDQPDFLPDRFEAGTLNNSGIIGLASGVTFVKKKGIESIYSHEMKIIKYIYSALSADSNAVLYTPSPDGFNSAPILSFNYKDYSSEETASLLGNGNIAVRGGFHCAPLAHMSFGTDERGTVRVSPSVFTSFKDCENFINYLKKL
ncbi:MAG: aminotransferase class V-fold PLP-dependent enzyme [Eubacterium sp.]|nr:aminotransferase class V-fold PLP-dependent enzyme [Eubacterium sp.]